MLGTWSISAEWIVPVSSEPIRRGVMRGRGAVIEELGPAGEVAPAKKHTDLGQVAVVPGFINAHTHLELTHLRGKLPQGAPMTQWLLALSRQFPSSAKQRRAVLDGVAEALSTGTTTLADISFNNRSAAVLAATPIRAVAFAEVTGIGPLASTAMRQLKRRLAGLPRAGRVRFGIAPHAPYSTSPQVYREAIALARRRRWLITTHLAETEGERQFLLRGKGRLLDLLVRLGMTDSSVGVAGCKPVELAGRLDLLRDDCILAHVNYIDDTELAALVAGGASVVYCPRSSAFFGRSGHRYPEMLARGINVALGTDSLASNWSLDMLEEMRCLRRAGRLDNETILRMATIHGAAALRMADRIGSLAPGKQADWTAIDVPETIEPLAAILRGQSPEREIPSKSRFLGPPAPSVRKTAIAGKIVYDRTDAEAKL